MKPFLGLVSNEQASALPLKRRLSLSYFDTLTFNSIHNGPYLERAENPLKDGPHVGRFIGSTQQGYTKTKSP